MLRKLLLLVSLCAGSARAATIFVAPIAGADDAAAALTSAVETAVLKRVIDADVVTPRALETKLDMDLAKACNGGGDDATCVVDFAQALGVDFVLRPTVAKLGDTRILTLAIYDGHKASLRGQGQRKAALDRPDLLADQVADLVAEVARAASLSVVVDHPRSPPYLAYSEVAGGVLVLLGAAAAHAFAFGVLEADYEAAKDSQAQARGWETVRPFAYGLPVVGYGVGAALVGLGLFTLTRDAP